MKERENILKIFEGTKKAVSEGNSKKVEELSNQTTNTASLTHDPDNIAAAVVVYALSKIIEDKDYKNQPGWKKFYEVYINSIDKIIEALENKDDNSYDKHIKIIREAAGNLSGKEKKHIQEVFRDASIDKASRIYEHGISMEKTANLLGVTLYELANYAGKKMKDSQDSPESQNVTVKSRIKLVEDMFG